jgi:ribosome modulation factor
VFFPSEGDRIVVTRTGRDGRTHSYIGTASAVTPYGPSTIGSLWVGGWRLTGHNMATGEAEDSHFACTEALERYDQGIRQTVRLATTDDE